MSELKGCSCGGKPKLMIANNLFRVAYFVQCPKCGKRTKEIYPKGNAVFSWNTSTSRPSRRKYCPGAKITSLNELMEQDFVYWRNKITPKGWFQNWQIGWVVVQIRFGVLRLAIKIESEENQ